MGCTLELDADLLSELGEPLEDNRAGTGLLPEPVGPAVPRTRAMVASQLLLLGGVDAAALPSGVPPAPDRAMYSPKDSFFGRFAPGVVPVGATLHPAASLPSAATPALPAAWAKRNFCRQNEDSGSRPLSPGEEVCYFDPRKSPSVGRGLGTRLVAHR